MSQCVRYRFDGDSNADAFGCERMARVVEMPFQTYTSADALEVVLYCGLRQIPSGFVCEDKSELIVPTITCFELPFGLSPFYALQKLNEMRNKGYDLRVPYGPARRFLGSIGDEVGVL